VHISGRIGKLSEKTEDIQIFRKIYDDSLKHSYCGF